MSAQQRASLGAQSFVRLSMGGRKALQRLEVSRDQPAWAFVFIFGVVFFWGGHIRHRPMAPTS